MAEGGVMRASGAIRVALAFAALLASLSLVVYRQSRALEVLRELDGLRSARAVAESERALLSAEAQELESRARIKRVAEARWGMRVPASGELVTLLAPRSAGVERVVALEVR
jgi:cell division protein FtsL